ncbi:fimbrial protein [Atlantibacter sp.]|uniref:fimbrial protein n=1 Tax=Atlantibacter sp. TaxID=1903473 RepID=UPI0028AC9702|nr:fimbrial protein [Atlantibacter sp.]
MKKLAIAFMVSSALMTITNTAMAEEVISHGHGMTIYARLENAKSGCTVLMSKYLLNLNHDDKSLPAQGSNINTYSADDHIYVQLGGENCDANEGYKNIGLKFLGTTDDSKGTTLANTDTSSTAAQGIGVQLSDMFNNIIEPNVTIGHFPSASPDGKSTTSTASFPLYFSLVQLNNQLATAGNIQTNLTVQIERL